MSVVERVSHTHAVEEESKQLCEKWLFSKKVLFVEFNEVMTNYFVREYSTANPQATIYSLSLRTLRILCSYVFHNSLVVQLKRFTNLWN